jgi:xylulokinase
MQPAYLLGIDVGTQGTKAILFRHDGKHVASAFRKSQLHQPAAGVVEEDPEQQFASVCHCAKSCLKESGIDANQVAAIGIDGQMAGILGVGRDGIHVTPYDSWLDTRCAPYIRIMRDRALDEIIRKTGGPPSFNHGPKVLWWKHERPAVYRRIASFVQPGGYAAMRLCGLEASQAFIDKTYLHFTGFADNVHGRWDEELCRCFEVSPAILPRIVEPREVIGRVSPAAARRSGLRSGTPVVAGCGDTAASFLACGATREGVCVDVAGTASVFAGTTGGFRADTQFGVLGWGQSATPGLWHPYAYINGGGMNIEWFARELAMLGGERTAETLEQLNRRAARLTPSNDDPLFVPHLGGRVSPSRPLLRGSWAGVTWSHSAAHLYRAILEGVALEYALYRNVLRTLNPELAIREIRITGGGEKSRLWNQIKADAMESAVVQIRSSDGAPLGSAMLAGYGVGLFDDLDKTAAQWVRTGKRIPSNPRMAHHYRQRLDRYERLLEAMQHWAEPNTPANKSDR